MRVVLFCHSLLSDWNHGNAHFLRGIASDLVAREIELQVFEPRANWSYQNLLSEARAQEALTGFAAAYPTLSSTLYDLDTLPLDEAVDNSDLVLVHEWSEPELVRRLGNLRKSSGEFLLLFHDTHHRSVTDPDALSRYDLSGFDGVLAFGESIAEVYRRYGWGRRVWVWHEAADTRVFSPVASAKTADLVWIGNWGDDERSRELSEFLFEPARALQLRGNVYGVRYPEEALRQLQQSGLHYGGWLPNFKAPQTFAHHAVTVHVPRGPYAKALPGVPTIRMFEALACGIPLVSAPWSDNEGMFRPGVDFLFAKDGAEMTGHLQAILRDSDLAQSLASHGRETILNRHTCTHRVDELLNICAQLRASSQTVPEPALRATP